MNKLALTAATAVAIAAMTGAAAARDQIRVVGSSTVFPFTQAVAEEFSGMTGYRAPVVEGTGTGGGMRIFCEGIGPNTPDFTGASRPMTESEWEMCRRNGVTNVAEALFGFDGLSIAVSRQGADLDLTEAQIFQALAAVVEVDGEIVANPHRRWSDIDPSLPDMQITVFGPPPTSGTRDAFVELVMHDGCMEFEAIAALREDNRDRWNEVCSRMRTDGPFVEAGENDNLIVQRLQQDPDALGIFGYSFLYENQDTLKAVPVNGVEPSPEAIADASYPVARPLFFYVKNDHRGVIPGLDEFVEEYVSEAAIGEDGYLRERGLVPLEEERRREMQDAVLSGQPFNRYGS